MPLIVEAGGPRHRKRDVAAERYTLWRIVVDRLPPRPAGQVAVEVSAELGPDERLVVNVAVVSPDGRERREPGVYALR